MASDPGDGLGHGLPARQHPLGPQPLQQPIRRRDLRQDRGDVAGVDVLPLQAPIQPRHHQRGVAAAGDGGGLVGVGSIAVVQGQLRCGPAQALQRCHHRAWAGAGIGGAVVAQVGGGRQGADHRQRAQPPERQQVAFIAQQHDRLPRRLAGQAPVGTALAQAAGVVPLRHRELQLQLPPHRICEPLRRQGACGQGLGQAALEHHAEGHFQVLARQQGRQPIADAEDEIAHHQALKSPAALEDVVEQ